MPKQFAHVAEDDRPEETLTRHGRTQPMPVVSARVTGDAKTKVCLQPSYHPTGSALANRMLDLIDALTQGRADWVQRAVSYCVIGGVAAVINVLTLGFVHNGVPIPGVSRTAHYALAFLLATEVSLMANFIPNDRITFRHLPGHSRRWLTRCGRFHLTAVGGILVTALVSGSLHLVAHVPAMASQAVALLVALAFNFTFHHLFTYRRQPKTP